MKVTKWETQLIEETKLELQTKLQHINSIKIQNNIKKNIETQKNLQEDNEILNNLLDKDFGYEPINFINDAEINIDEEKALKWLNNGAIPTDTVKNLFSKAGINAKFAESKVKKAAKAGK